jgi:hypothetical protein
VVYIDELGRSDKNDGTTGDGSDRDGRRLRRRIERDEIHALQSQMAGLQQENHELKAQLQLFSNHTDRQLTTLNRNIKPTDCSTSGTSNR